ncbi:hypothetical protein [Kitasatospora purpeofusca]|uniref:hypothetical protein n=1 Tax=Kitasatospora purpeofusca TaxID=67352 RepID=UPI002257005D|nr:hypothetical protein [Kitasatospora purpeofusca]MCX4757173.1 hypothetical protein [Kitasatospora purpeofusca]WSR35067.1 hypothetical protein OG715_31405 [Kitasatospora purpeofusca]
MLLGAFGAMVFGVVAEVSVDSSYSLGEPAAVDAGEEFFGEGTGQVQQGGAPAFVETSGDAGRVVTLAAAPCGDHLALVGVDAAFVAPGWRGT